MPNNTLLEVKDLKMYFENKKGFLGKKIEYVKAVDGVSFKILFYCITRSTPGKESFAWETPIFSRFCPISPVFSILIANPGPARYNGSIWERAQDAQRRRYV